MTGATPPEGPDTIGPDAWLREALRHAPDADVAVPHAVREAILRQARAAVLPAVAAPRAGGWRPWIEGWLKPSRLGYSGAFVVLLVVGVWGLDGLDERAREPLAPSHPEAVVADASPAVAASTPAPASVSPASDGVTPIVAAAATKAQGRGPAAPVGARAPAAAPGAREATMEAARESALADNTAAPASPERAVTPAGMSTPTPSPAPPVLAERAAAPDAGTPVGALKAAAPAATRAAAPKAAPPGAGTSPLATQQDPAGVAPLDPLASVLRLATEGASMRWTAGSREGPIGAPQRAWLDTLRAATAGRWARASVAPVAPAVQLSSSAGPLVSLSTEGTPATLWVVIGVGVYRAPLSEEALARFEDARSRW